MSAVITSLLDSQLLNVLYQPREGLAKKYKLSSRLVAEMALS